MRVKRFALFFVLAALLLSGCTSLRKADRVIVTTGFKQDEIFRVMNESGTARELLVYLVNMYNSYPEGFDAEDTIRESCLALCAQIKAMNLLAQRLDLSLSAEERALCAEAAQEYVESLTEYDIRAMGGVTKEFIAAMYQEIALADKVYAYAIRDINPEISDDEARTITLEQIVVYKGDGPQRALQKITEAKAKLDAGEDFARLLAAYNEASTDRVSFGEGEGKGVPEDIAFSLAGGEISGIAETNEAYYLLRCVSSFDREQTRENKVRIVESRRQEAFGVIYDTFAAELPVQLNEAAWEALTVPRAGQTTDSFWRVYDSYFP